MLPESISNKLPESAKVQIIACVSMQETGQRTLFTFPASIQKQAVIVDAKTLTPSTREITLLTIPAVNFDDPDLLNEVRNWIEEASSWTEPASLMLTLQGVQLLWSPSRIALFAEPDRLETVQKSVLEVTYYIAELQCIEQELGELWPQLEGDTPLAFEFTQRDLYKHKQLMSRYQVVATLRARLARITPYLLSPHVYPPTLASQVGERLRERTRVDLREEFLSDQLEVFENVYELCGQRSSDFLHTRSGNILEWTIIILLMVQIVFSAFELLTSFGATNALSVG